MILPTKQRLASLREEDRARRAVGNMWIEHDEQKLRTAHCAPDLHCPVKGRFPFTLGI